MKRFPAVFIALLLSLFASAPAPAQLQLNSPAFQQLKQESGDDQAPAPAPDAKGSPVLDPDALKQLGLTPEDLSKIEGVATLIKQEWVDGDGLKSQDLFYGALKGMAKTLDPHSEFYTPEEYKQFQQELSGTYAGIGAVLKRKEIGQGEEIEVPVPGSPAQKAGVRAGDVIIEVDGQNVGPMTTDEVRQKVVGKEGASVTLKLSRKSAADPKKSDVVTVVIPRADVEMPNVYSQMLKPGVGYIYFTEFREDTADVFLQQLSVLQAQGLRTLIIDERDNPGGSVRAAVKICGLFLHKGQKIVSMKDRAGTEHITFAPDEGPYVGLEVKILVNGNSASASEIVAGCLQDDGRAKIYGETTFGKGSAQMVIPFSDGSALKLTVNKWYTPSGKSIQGDEGGLKKGVGVRGGIAPDVAVQTGGADEAKVMTRLYEKLMGAPLDPPGPVADPVLEKALEQ